MLKRTLSFLLCLIMVLGFAAPSVKATGTDDGSASNFLDGIYIPEGSDGTVIVNGEDVTEEVKKNTFDDIPSQGEMTTPTTSPSIPAVVDLCQCVDLATAEDHSGVCKVKAHYYDLCNASEEELYAQWASFTPVEQSFIREYLRETFPLKLVAIEQMLSVPNSSASELLADGTTVSVEGIPEYSSLTVADAADDVKNIVDAYVAENQAASTELFSYDVSVQDAEGSDWQPDTSVKMELELPGQKLHKYSKVYVVHVDDNGVATTIEAEVTEDGKIAFETPGFSTFVGFTVDFEFNGIQMSIPGMSGIKLSALLDSLKVPVYAEDVVDVVYTDYTQLKIEQLEGDWLLTSLKAFTTEEILTLFMADGAVYEIKVTDAIVGQRADCHFAYNGSTGNICFIDVSYHSGGDHNGVVTILVSDNTGYGVTTYDNASQHYANDNSYWWLMRVVFDGNGVFNDISNGATEVCIEKNGKGDDFKVPVVNWYITGGATVNVYLEGFDSNDTISFESWVDGSPLITVDDGTLYFNVDSSVLPKDTSTTSGYIRNFHVTACPYKEIILDGYDNVVDNEDAIIFADDSAKAVYVNDVKFIKSARRAVYIQADKMSEFRMDNCIFDSTIKSANGGGGAIYMAEKTSGGAWVNVEKFTLRYCEFDQQKVASTEKTSDGKPKVVRGGAVLIWGKLDNTNFYHCKFYKTNATAQGGAVAIGDQKNTFDQGDITFEGCEFDGTTNDNSLAGAVLICQLSKKLEFKNCEFKNITGAGHGGVIHIGGTDDVGITYASFTMTGCSFNNCKTTGGRGGVLRLYSTTANPVTITDCTFTTCSAYSLGGALSFQGTIGTLTISGTAANKSSFSDCESTNEKGGAISLDATITKCEIKNTSFSTCKSQTKNGGAIYHGGITGDFDVTNCSFTSCEALVYGGAIALYGRTTTTDITGGSFTTCKAGGTQAMFKEDKVTPIYDKKGNHMYNGTGGGAAICIVQNHGTINIGGTSTTKQTFSNCESLNNGGAISFEGSCEVQTCNIQYVSIDGCKARDSGSAILLGDVTVVNMSIKDSEIKNCSYVSGYTGDDAIKNSLYDEYYTEGMDYDSIIFRTNDSHGTIRTIGSVKAQLVVESVTFTNNTSLTGGGGIYWNANRLSGYTSDKDGTYTFKNSLAIKNCTFEDNYAFRDGGAIYVEASLTVEGGTFKNNSAQRGGAIAQQIYNNSGRPIQSGETNNLIITGYTSGSTTTKAVFDGNYARKHGGAISVLCNATGSITTTESAPAMSYPITCQITGAEIKNNRAAENGGGVYFYQMSYPTDYADPGSMTETETALDNKEVEGYVKSLILDGSSVFGNYSGCGKDKLTTPESANGSGHGGGIYLNAKKNTTLQVLGCNVYSNTAHYGNGGGIYMTGEGGVCQMKENSAGTVTVIGGSADKANKATSSAPGTAEGQNTGNGGGIGIFIKGRIEMQGGTVSYNTAETAGGGIAVNGSTMEFSNGTVTNNTAKYGGGVSLTNSGDPSTIADESLEKPPALTPAWGMVFTNGTVTKNVADIGGGICVSNGSTMKLDGGKVNTNYAATKSGSSYSYKTGQHGGGIAVVAGSKMNIYAGEVKSNHAGSGGGITIQGGSALQMLPKPGTTDAGVVASNWAYSDGGGYGGGIYLAPKATESNKNTLYVNNGTIELNKGYYGAGIALLQQSEAKLNSGKIYKNEGNSTNCLGGGAYVYGAKLSISGAELSYNYGQNSGGAIYARTTSSGDGSIASEVSVTSGSIHHNHTRTGWGGGIYMLGSGSSTTGSSTNISGGKIYENYTENSGSNGGGINVENGCTLTITGGEIYKNTAYSNGGGINTHSYATVNITGGDIYSNTTRAGTGGGIYAYNHVTMTITGGDIYSNTAATYGGGMHASNHTNLTFKGGEIRDNSSGAGGGGVAVSWYSNATVSTSDDGTKIGKIMNNTAVRGGGVYVEGASTLTVNNGYIINNKAVGKPASTSGITTGYKLADDLLGVGGGICIVSGTSSNYRTTFTLTGENIAIYGNLADFAGDDVFSNGDKTKLTVPTVDEMNLAEYDFDAEGWVEDYCANDTAYTSNGLNMRARYKAKAESEGKMELAATIGAIEVERYRNAPSVNKNYMLIGNEYVTGTGISGQYVEKNDAYVCMTLGIPAAVDDVVVIDYGFNVAINMRDNDTFITATDFNDNGYVGLKVPTSEINVKHNIRYSSGTTYRGTFGRPSIHSSYMKYGNVYMGDDGLVTYGRGTGKTTLNFTDEETFAYTVKHGDYWFYATVTVVPATTLYFEDNCDQVTYQKNADSTEDLADWVEIGSNIAGVQDQDRPGNELAGDSDVDGVYGYDSHYLTNSTYSNGKAHKVTVTRDKNTGKTTSARAYFTFTGTGFDIISMSSQATGAVMVTVYEGTVTSFSNTPTNNIVASYYVDTYYETSGNLYQVPVIRADLTKVQMSEWDSDLGDFRIWYKNYGYRTYTVELYVSPGFFPENPGYYSSTFYLDAIRIHNPAGIGGSNSKVAQDAYLEDGECWPVYHEVRDLFLSANDYQDMIGKTDKELEHLEKLNKVLFIDGSITPTVADYLNKGPNNEVYLKPGDAIAFTLDNNDNWASVHLGLRGLNKMGYVTVKAQSEDDEKEKTILDNISLSTADMYYDISDRVDGEVTTTGKTIVITNSGTTDISISNVKITHKEAPSDDASATWTRINMTTGKIALDILNAEQLVESPVVTPKSPALSFNGMVCYNVFFSAKNLGELTSADLGLAVFNTEDPDGTVETADEVHLGATRIDGLYMVATDGVHAKYLGDTKYFRAFAKKSDGTYVYSKMVSYSALDYAKNALAKSDDVKLKQLVVAMLNYGAAAQMFFDYKADDLMNKDLTADDQALLAGYDASMLNPVGKVDASRIGIFESTGGFTRRAPAISFKGAFEINYFFTPANAVDGDMKLYIWSEDTYNNDQLSIHNADKVVVMTSENGTYSGSSDEIAAKYLDKTVYVAAVYESDGVTYCSGVMPYSIAAYCQKPPAGVQALATAAAIYGCTAKEYFGV